jgi:NADH:ubiquinone oxidoreductase subunit C
MEPMISIESVLDALREVVRTYAGAGGSHALDVRCGPIDEVWAALPARCVRPAVQMMVQELGIWHLSAITAVDLASVLPEDAVPQSKGLEVMYHFWLGRGLTLRCVLPYDAPYLESVRDLIPGAAFYEREVSEMLHVVFDGHPTSGPFLLPDDWEGAPPLRKEETP